jgi:ABC-type bacteriocin/lantibiotic exporter with double-glycine peptidase domain
VNVRNNLVKQNAKLEFLSVLPRFIMDLTLIIGITLIGASAYILKGGTDALLLLGAFLLGFSRVAPAALRFQGYLLRMESSNDLTSQTLDFLEENIFEGINRARNGDESQKKLTESRLIRNSENDVRIELNSIQVKFSDGEKDVTVIDGISKIFNQGKLYALVGQSGSGKSTMLKVLFGNVTPSKGSVFINGLTPKAFLRKFPGELAYVPQDPVIVSGTLLENMALTRENIEQENLRSILYSSALEELVEQRIGGVHSTTIELGNNLSGGQKQRIAIARALWGGPSIVLLDEPTSALDDTNSKRILETLVLNKDKCIFIIATHDPRALSVVDEIIHL